jgi:hypothetical protein
LAGRSVFGEIEREREIYRERERDSETESEREIQRVREKEVLEREGVMYWPAGDVLAGWSVFGEIE